MATITITNPKYIQFKDAAGALHYYQHYPPIERKDVTDYIFYRTKPYGYDVRSNVIRTGTIYRVDTTFCLYLYYTNYLPYFENNSKLQGSFTESTFGTTGPLKLTGLEGWGMAAAYSSYSRQLMQFRYCNPHLTDTWIRPDKSGSIHLFDSNVNYTNMSPIADDDWENLVIYTDAWRYVFGIGRYYTQQGTAPIKSRDIYLTCNPTMATKNLKAELIDESTGQTLRTVNKTDTMKYMSDLKSLNSIRLRISNGRVSYDRQIIFSSLPSTSYLVDDLREMAYINWQGQWGWIEKTYPTTGTGGIILSNSINTFYGVNPLVQGGLYCNDKTIIEKKRTNSFRPILYSFVISEGGYQHIAENPTTHGEFVLTNFQALTGYMDSRIIYYNLDDDYRAFVQS